MVGSIGLDLSSMGGQGSTPLATLLHMCCPVGPPRPTGLTSLRLQTNLSSPELKTVTVVTHGAGNHRPPLSGKPVCSLEEFAPRRAYTPPS